MSEGDPIPVNKLLATLPANEYQRLLPHLEPVRLPARAVLYAPGEAIEAVYFPTEGLISLVTILENGGISETGLVGREGVVGFPAFLGNSLTTNSAIVQISGSALKLDVKFLKQHFKGSQTLRQQLLLYAQALLTQVSQTAICNLQHDRERQLARLLLCARDCTEREDLSLSSEFIANLLGIQVESAVMGLKALQQSGILRYQRDRIEIIAPLALEARACQCYRLVQDEYFRLLGY